MTGGDNPYVSAKKGGRQKLPPQSDTLIQYLLGFKG